MARRYVGQLTVKLFCSLFRASKELLATVLLLGVLATCNSSTFETAATSIPLVESSPEKTCATGEVDPSAAKILPTTATTTAATTATSHDEECGIWLALSTLPGTGIGMFAGKEFHKDEYLMAAGDHIIPIIDFQLYQDGDIQFLWDEYTWNPENLYLEDLGQEAVDVASTGFGAAANSFLDFVNADEQYPTYSIPHGLHRRSDPGAGAFTYYHSRRTKASNRITPGEELFVAYGANWFLTRKNELGPIPIKGDYERADAMYRKYRQIFREIVPRTLHGSQEQVEDREIKEEHPKVHGSSESQVAAEAVPPLPTDKSHLAEMEEELWETFLLNAAWDDSPTMAALPAKENFAAMNTQSLRMFKKSQMYRDTEWLQENGVCADTMHMGLSTIRQAGHGAFASRRLRQDAIILPIPLIHIPDRKVLNMYELSIDSEESIHVNRHQLKHPQLLLNYCLGHRDSTLLLSPYGPVFNLINHNQTLANVRLQWASPKRSQHNPDLLNMTLTYLSDIYCSQLAMELVALRDIDPGEEIFLDYGDEWEAAWQKHVQEWEPVEGADTYVSAFEMNQQSLSHRFRTESEQTENPYPDNLMLKFHKHFRDERIRRSWIKQHRNPVASRPDSWMRGRSVECEILGYKVVENRTLYTVAIPIDEFYEDWTEIDDVPQEAIFFQDQPHSTDTFLENAFRHDIRIPDEIFPDMWKNLVSKN